MGRAALVFVGPHVLDPGEDVAEFGWSQLVITEGGSFYQHYDPYPDARVVAWFNSPEVGRKYSVEFLCGGLPGHSFFLHSSAGGISSVQIPGSTSEKQTLTEYLTEIPVSVTFVHSATDKPWRWFSVSGNAHWRIRSLEIAQFPS
jgi:hypothetical protein